MTFHNGILWIGLSALVSACGGGDVASEAGSTTATATVVAADTATASVFLSASSTASASVSVSAPVEALLLGNELAMTIGYWSGNSKFPNQGYVSVKLCLPQTDNCQTIDRVLVDTGSFGLRVLASALTLPLQQSTLNGAALSECTRFTSGYTWGGVYGSDVVLGQQKASGVPIQVIDPKHAGLPNSCIAGSGPPLMTQDAIGANGILGVGSFQHDCPACATQALAGHYYTCTQATCSPVAVPLSAQVVNPVAMMATNNNGVVIDLKSVPATTPQTTASGKLILGIDTQANNTLQGESVFGLDSNGRLSTTYNGITYTQSLLDSGANGVFVTDNTLSLCPLATGLYCSSTDLLRTATISSNTTSQTVRFVVSNPELLAGQALQPGLVGQGSSFTWGLPFFYGRKVFVSISGKPTPGRTPPFVAF